MGKREKKEKFVDDGRVIAPMNVEGMPWYTPKNRNANTAAGADSTLADSDPGALPPASLMPLMLTRSEKIGFTLGILKAVLLVGIVFIGGLLAFILFCTEIWFR